MEGCNSKMASGQVKAVEREREVETEKGMVEMQLIGQLVVPFSHQLSEMFI